MKKRISFLLLLFIIQSIAVVTLYGPDSVKLMTMGSAERLVPFEPYLLDEIHIGDANGNEAVLLKAGDRWILPDLSGLSISPELIENFLQGVIHADDSWPVATTVAARQRFQLADYHFLRRLTLIGNGELLGTIYLGSSPGFRKVHARNSSQDAIFIIPFNSFDAPAIASAWLDKRTLQIHSPVSISSPQYELTKENGQWQSAQGGKPEKRELNALLLALDSLQIESVAGDDMQRTLSIAVPEIKLDIKTEDGGTSYEMFTVGDRHYIHCSDHSLFFTMSAYDFDRFSTLDNRRLRGTKLTGDNNGPQ